jgi:hypothetical protein
MPLGFLKIFKFKELVWLLERTGKELAVKGRFFDLIVIFVSFLFVNACNGDTLFGDISFHKTEQDCGV